MSDRRASIALFLFFLALQAFAATFNVFAVTWGDPVAYLALPSNILFHNSYSFNNYMVGVPPPLYPILLLPALALSDLGLDVILAISILNCICYAAFVFLLFKFKKVCDFSFAQTAVLAALILLTPCAFQFTQDIMTESLYFPLLAFGFYLALMPASVGNLTSLMIVLLSLVLTKPIGMVPYAILGAWKAGELLLLRRDLQSVTWSALLVFFPGASLLLWLILSPKLADLTGGGYQSGYTEVLIGYLTDASQFWLLLQRLFYSFIYTLMGAYFLPLLFLLPLKQQVDAHFPLKKALILYVLLWLGCTGLCAVAQGVFFPRNTTPSYLLYGRYIEGLIPIATILGFYQLVRLLRSEEKRTKSYYTILTLVVLLVFLIIANFPYEFWTGIHVISIATYLYTGELIGGVIFVAIIFALGLFALLMRGQKYNVIRYVMFFTLLTMLGYSTVREMLRVDDRKQNWKDRITKTKFHEVSPPSETKFLIIDPTLTHGKELWYLKGVYFKARYLYAEGFDFQSAPQGSLYFSSSIIPPQGFTFCDTRNWAKVHCKPIIEP